MFCFALRSVQQQGKRKVAFPLLSTFLFWPMTNARAFLQEFRKVSGRCNSCLSAAFGVVVKKQVIHCDGQLKNRTPFVVYLPSNGSAMAIFVPSIPDHDYLLARLLTLVDLSPLPEFFCRRRHRHRILLPVLTTLHSFSAHSRRNLYHRQEAPVGLPQNK